MGRSYGFTLAEMERGLALVQSFEPAGIAARFIQEQLLIQTRRCQHVPIGTERVLEYYYDDFLKTLSLQPVLQAETQTDYIRADIEIFCDAQGKLQIRSLEELPEVFFEMTYMRRIEKTGIKQHISLFAKLNGNFGIYRQPWPIAGNLFLQLCSISYNNSKLIFCRVIICGR